MVSNDVREQTLEQLPMFLMFCVDDILQANVSTIYPSGFSLTLDLQSAENKQTTYNVEAVFEGDEPCSATAYALTPNGTEYAICTTIQFSYKPAGNMTSITVEPQATQVTVPTKTAEQMQAEAEDSGWLTVWHEFTWWYPWYRFHIIYLPGGQKHFDLGIGLLGGSIIEAFQVFLNRLNVYLQDFVADVFVDYILGELVALVGSMSGNFLLWLGTLVISIGLRMWLLLQECWNSIEKLRTSYVAQWVTIMIEVGYFIYTFSWNALLKMAQGIVLISTVAWNIITTIANVLVDVVWFLHLIDVRLGELGGL
jgi:hypothetical protein